MESLVQYLRKRRGGQRVRSGVLVARKVKGNKKNKVLVGWSKCKLTVDRFDPKRGLEIANARIDQRVEDKDAKKHKVPPSIKEALSEFKDRASRYFKTERVTVV